MTGKPIALGKKERSILRESLKLRQVVISLLCKNINMFVNFYEIGIYLKYCTPHPLGDYVKMW